MSMSILPDFENRYVYYISSQAHTTPPLACAACPLSGGGSIAWDSLASVRTRCLARCVMVRDDVHSRFLCLRRAGSSRPHRRVRVAPRVIGASDFSRARARKVVARGRPSRCQGKKKNTQGRRK